MRYFTLPVITGATPSDSDAYWYMAEDAARALPVYCGPGFDWIALDPYETTPNVLLGVVLPEGRAHVLAPGGVMPVSRSMSRFNVFNAHKAITTDGLQGSGKRGRVALCGGTAAELPMFMAASARLPTPKAAILVSYALLAGFYVMIPTSNLKGVRVTVYPIDGLGAALPTPVDFAATLRPYVSTMSSAPDTINAQFGSYGLNGEVLGRPTGAPVSLGRAPKASGDLIFDQTEQVADLEVLVPALFLWLECTALAGTAVDRIIVTVEGR